MNNNFSSIEKILLPENCYFSQEQKEVLQSNGSYNIVAGPGSGKTTVLTAKIANLLLNRKYMDKGICLITHTNVAVEEVIGSLRKVGINSVEYPNVIGTIQEFFNYFFSIKAFKILSGRQKIRILDDEDYKVKLEPIFRSCVDWYEDEWNIPNLKKQNVCLKVNEKGCVYFTNDAKISYQSQLNDCLERLFYNGFVTNHQCLELSEWYINRHIIPLSKALEERFSYIILDEAQDTSVLQYSLLNKLTCKTNIKFQKYGDPYQSLYSIYERDSRDAWSPNFEVSMGVQVKEIAETTRFGTTICNVVKNVCMENYDHFRSLEIVDSLSPYFLVFESKEELIIKYKKLIKKCEETNESFKDCQKKDVIVSDMHANLERYFPSYTKEKKSQTFIKYNYHSLFNYLVNKFSVIYQKSRSEMKLFLTEDKEKSKLSSILLKELSYSNVNKIKVEDILSRIIVEVTNVDVKQLAKEIICQVNNIKKNNMEDLDKNEKYVLNTIHGVKGETHRSTMLIMDSSLNYGSTNNNDFFHLIKPFLIGSRFNYDSHQDKDKIKSILKLAYVALSRPKYLIIIAIPQKDITLDYKMKLIENSWIEIV
ncbi:UvrD-helicase domain-containing protein [Enterococcus spodopteracolus]|uniref:UvrD-helicase domain-containing protein n=1 Tax=Enterococcus spodopteracolus TaxID=3034501 RepID=UPI00264913DD|nr:UvrD-helicase domain-containing protein [Enterococcus spodopteracolus]